MPLPLNLPLLRPLVRLVLPRLPRLLFLFPRPLLKIARVSEREKEREKVREKKCERERERETERVGERARVNIYIKTPFLWVEWRASPCPSPS